MLYVGGDVDNGAGKYLHGGFTFLLIPASSGYTYKHLAATFFSFVYMPIVAATRLESDIKEGYLIGGYWSEIAVAGEIFGVCCVRFADREYHRAGKGGFCIFAIDVVVPHLFGEVEGSPRFGPTGIESYVGNDFSNLCAGNTVLFRCREVVFERVVGYALLDERCDCHEAAVAQRKEIVAAPHFAEKNVIVEVSELRGKVTKLLATCRLRHLRAAS